VDNILNYVNDNRYLGSWINRAPANFVLQMGGLFSNTKRPPLAVNDTRGVVPFAPVRGVSPSLIKQSNKIGTVSMALSNGPNGQPDINSGTSSFFINVGNNTQLDSGFTVFATIPDMTVVNQIMALNKTNLAAKFDPTLPPNAQDVTFTDVPLQTDAKQVFVTRAFVVTDATTSTATAAAIQSLSAQSATAQSGITASSSAGELSAAVGAPLTISDPAIGTSGVPEPASIATALISAAGVAFYSSRRRRAAKY
jgi:cyclophilin family peptidyl-prolyl cis-trans isomerase